MDVFHVFKIVQMVPKSHNALHLSETFSETFKGQLSFLSMSRIMAFFTRLKTIAMCFRLNIFHNNLTGNVYKQFFFRNIVGCYQNSNPSERIFIGIISSPKFWKNSLCCSHVLIRTEPQPTVQNSFKLLGCFEIAAPKTLENIQKIVCNRVPY